jgi:hypothetical protein
MQISMQGKREFSFCPSILISARFEVEAEIEAVEVEGFVRALIPICAGVL